MPSLVRKRKEILLIGECLISPNKITRLCLMFTDDIKVPLLFFYFLFSHTHTHTLSFSPPPPPCSLSDDMKRLVHLKYCIKESLRLCPPVPAVGRVLNQDTDITGYIMPKGTSVVCYTYAIHRHPDFWENPHVSN